VHWSIEDPTRPSDGGRVTRARFRRLVTEIDDRLAWLICAIDEGQQQPSQQRSTRGNQ